MSNPPTPRIVTAEEIAEWTGGTVLQSGTGAGFQFDSRLLKEQEWFVVLQGARDGHEFLGMAQGKGCAGAIGQHMPKNWTGAFVQVEDSLLAFQQIAQGMRTLFQNPVVGITGSAGKTTTRALIASVLEGLGVVHQTSGNFNNHIGVPKTITDTTGLEQAWVLEMGMSALGEIHRLQEIAAPNIRLITNVGAAHVEGCGSIEGVAQAKGELFAGAGVGDICCVNLEDERVRNLPIPEGARRLTYGRQEVAEIRLLQEQVEEWSTLVRIQTPKGIFSAIVPVPGSFMALNACAAACVGFAAGLDLDTIAKGIASYQPVGMRMKLEQRGVLRIINDAYNANPLSMVAALDSLKAQKGSTIAFLGDMLEMGTAEESAHLEVLEHALTTGCKLGLVGPRFAAAWASLESKYPEQKIEWLAPNAQALSETWIPPSTPTTILLKGSRGMRMETLISRIAE